MGATQYINNVPVATKMKLAKHDIMNVIVQDGELYLPQATLVHRDNGSVYYFPYYLKISKENIRALLSEVDNE